LTLARNGTVAIAYHSPGDVRVVDGWMVEGPRRLGQKLCPHAVAGTIYSSSSLDSCRVGWVGGDGSLGPGRDMMPFLGNREFGVKQQPQLTRA
jgi:hypothetical protein